MATEEDFRPKPAFAEEPDQGQAMAAITNEIVSLHKRYYGKGPTKAKTHQVDDTVICILGGGFTTVEQTLIADGREDVVHTMRRSFQGVMRQEFIAVVERSTGRKVGAYMSQVHASPDIAVELFVLEPLADATDAADGTLPA